MRNSNLTVILLCAAALHVVGCARSHSPPPKVSTTTASVKSADLPAPTPQTVTESVSSGRTFTFKPAAIQIRWPGGWSEQKDEQSEWKIVPDDLSGTGTAWISLDVPTLPWHPRGLIPINRVEAGYLDDLRSSCGTLDVKELPAPTLPESKTRYCRATWTENGRDMQQTALLVVHDDHVYIFRARSPVAMAADSQQALDAVIASVRWWNK